MKFGPSGIGSKHLDTLNYLKEKGLDALEIPFTYGVWMSNDDAKIIGEEAKKLGISLSIHAPYYINLNSEDIKKISASKKRILDSCERGHYLGAKYIVFHAGFYLKNTKEETYQQIKKEILNLNVKIKEKKWDVVLCPETTGKSSQFGDLDELIRLSKETKCGICIDFSHIYARDLGKIDYDIVLKKIKGIKNITCHFSGIVYGPKGEKHHIKTEKSRTIELLKYLNKYNLSFRIINESPEQIEDALMMKKEWNKLK